MRLRDLDEPGSLPPTIDTATFAEWLAVSPASLYKLVREGYPPIQPLRIGRSIRWSTRQALAFVAGEADDTGSTEPTSDDGGPSLRLAPDGPA